MKHLFLLCWILSAPVLAQTGFFLRPVIEKKVQVNPEKPFDFTTDQGNKVEVVPSRLIYPAGLDIGLVGGFKRANWFIELGVFRDQALAGAKLGHVYLNGSDTLSHVVQNTSYYHGHGYARRSVTFGFKFTGDRPISASRKARWEIWGTVGIHKLRRPPNAAETPLGALWQFNQRDSMSYFADMQSPVRSNWYVSTGFMAKAYNLRGHSLVNLGIFYGQVLNRNSPMVVSALTFTNYTDGKQYRNWIRGFGSGFYFQVSKDIYLNNILRPKRPKPGGLEQSPTR